MKPSHHGAVCNCHLLTFGISVSHIQQLSVSSAVGLSSNQGLVSGLVLCLQPSWVYSMNSVLVPCLLPAPRASLGKSLFFDHARVYKRLSVCPTTWKSEMKLSWHATEHRNSVQTPSLICSTATWSRNIGPFF